MFGLPDNAAIIRWRDVLEKRRQRRRLLLDMSVTQTLTGYWMVCVCMQEVMEGGGCSVPVESEMEPAYGR